MPASPVEFTLFVRKQEKKQNGVLGHHDTSDIAETYEARDDKNSGTRSKILTCTSRNCVNASYKNDGPTANSSVINSSALDLDEKDGSIMGCLEFFYSSFLLSCSNQNSSASLTNDNYQPQRSYFEREDTLKDASEQSQSNTQTAGETRIQTDDIRDEVEKSSEQKRKCRSVRKVLVPRMLNSKSVQKLVFGSAKDIRADAATSTTSIKRAPSTIRLTKINHSATEVSHVKDFEQNEEKRETPPVAVNRNNSIHCVESSISRATNENQVAFHKKDILPNSKIGSTELKVQTLRRGRWEDAGQF